MINLSHRTKLFSMLLGLSCSLAMLTCIAQNGGTGEVLSSTEQGKRGSYTVTESGYYLINLRGADGGDGQDVHIESDGMGSYDRFKGNATASGGSGVDGGSVSTLVYLKKGQTLSYSIGSDGINYVEEAYRFEDLQRGCIHVYPNSNPLYKPDEYVDAGYGGGGGEGTWVALDDIVIAGAAGGGGGGGSVAACANWGSLDPSGFGKKSANGGNAEAVSSKIAESFDSVESFNGSDGGKSKGESVTTGEYYPEALGHPQAPKFKLSLFEAGLGGSSGTSYINTSSAFYYGNNIPQEVSDSGAYKNASSPKTSGIVITFVFPFEFPIKLKFFDSLSIDETIEILPNESIDVTIPIPDKNGGYFKGWTSTTDKKTSLVRDYYESNVINVAYTDAEDSEYQAEWYDTTEMGKEYISNAKAQAVSISDANGDIVNAVRFLAVIDDGYKSYKQAGFIISTDCPTPTVEAGYIYSTQSVIYKQILTKSPTTGEEVYLSVDSPEIKSLFGFESGAGLLYTNLVITDGNEDTVYYATPYVINKKGEYVYGEAKAVSFNTLKEYDTAIKSE